MCEHQCAYILTPRKVLPFFPQKAFSFPTGDVIRDSVKKNPLFPPHFHGTASPVGKLFSLFFSAIVFSPQETRYRDKRHCPSTYLMYMWPRAVGRGPINFGFGTEFPGSAGSNKKNVVVFLVQTTRNLGTDCRQ